MKVFRLVFSIVALLIFVCVTAAVCLMIFMNPNKLKPTIMDEISEKSGYQPMIDGDLSWTLYPRPGVKIQHMTLTVPSQSAAFAEMYDVVVVANLADLFQRVQTLRGDVYISNMKLMNVNLADVHIGLHSDMNVLTLNPMTASLYGGSLEGVMHGNNLSAQPTWDWGMRIHHIQMQPLLEDVSGPDSKIKIAGTGELTLQASSEGVTRQQLLSHLNGTTEFSMTDGKIEGIDLNFMVTTADAIINRLPIPTQKSANETSFSSLTGKAIIKDGNANLDNLLLQSLAFKADGQGQLNLIAQTLDYHLQVAPIPQNKVKWEIPVMLSGNLYAPDVRLDMTRIEQLVASEKLDEAKASVNKEIKKIPDQANKLIKNLLGNQ